jgi:hypothetical protein
MSRARLLGVAAACLLVSGSGAAAAAGLVTGADVRNSTLTGKDSKDRSLSPADFKTSVRGPAGPAGAAGADARAGYHWVVHLPNPNVSVPGNTFSYEVAIACPAGETPIGGNALMDVNLLVDSYPLPDGHTWQFRFGNAQPAPQLVRPYVYCAT